MSEPSSQQITCGYKYPHVPHKHTNKDRQPGSSDPFYVRCPGVKIPPGTRAYPASLRRLVLADLRQASKYLGYTISDWQVESRVWESGVGFTRPRQIDEYPENSAASWRSLLDDCDRLITMLTALREVAEDAIRHVEEHDKA